MSSQYPVPGTGRILARKILFMIHDPSDSVGLNPRSKRENGKEEHVNETSLATGSGSKYESRILPTRLLLFKCESIEKDFVNLYVLRTSS